MLAGRSLFTSRWERRPSLPAAETRHKAGIGEAKSLQDKTGALYEAFAIGEDAVADAILDRVVRDAHPSEIYQEVHAAQDKTAMPERRTAKNAVVA